MLGMIVSAMKSYSGFVSGTAHLHAACHADANLYGEVPRVRYAQNGCGVSCDAYLTLQSMNDISSLVAASLTFLQHQHLCLLFLQLALELRDHIL